MDKPQLPNETDWHLINRHDNATRFTPRIMEKIGLKPKAVMKAYQFAEKISDQGVYCG